MPRLRVLLVDDERLARQELRSMLGAHQDVEIVGEAETIDLAVAQVDALAPDGVFLDVQMPPDSGFMLLERAERRFRVVFVTAHDAYAIRAFEVNALDYLLKPVHPERLADAVRRLARETPRTGTLRRLDYADRVFVEVSGRARFVTLELIAAVRAAGDYSEIVTTDGDTLLVTSTMRDWDVRLPPEHFARIHRSMIVNLNHVDRIDRALGRGYRVAVRGLRDAVVMSRRYAVRVRDRFR